MNRRCRDLGTTRRRRGRVAPDLLRINHGPTRLAGAGALDGGAQLAVALASERDGDDKPPCVVEVLSLVVLPAS